MVLPDVSLSFLGPGNFSVVNFQGICKKKKLGLVLEVQLNTFSPKLANPSYFHVRSVQQRFPQLLSNESEVLQATK